MGIKINPDLYHGSNIKSNFFEGWYFKFVSYDNSSTLAFIPGIALGTSPNQNHSFIQVLDGNTKTFTYCKYDANNFHYSNTPFGIKISDSSFSFNEISLNINVKSLSINGKVTLKNLYKWKDSIINPGSMGFYNYLNFMECYSQVCAIDGEINGFLIINGKKINFTNGKIYIEKNWGKSFPVEWLWVQCNTFEDKRATLTCSLGEIPFPLKNFRGFLIGVTIDNNFYKFTTINRSKLSLSKQNNDIELISINKKYKLWLKTFSNKDDFILCYGPKNGEMSPYVNETLIGKVHMKLINTKTNEILYDGIGHNTGIEYGGKLMNINN